MPSHLQSGPAHGRVGGPCSPRLVPHCPGRSCHRHSGEGRYRGRWDRCRRPAGFHFRGARPGRQGAEDPALAGRLWAPSVAGRLRRAPREQGPGTESRAPGCVLVCLPRPRHCATVQLPARGKRPAFQPHPEATVSQTKPSGHCHVCEKGADCSRSPSSTCEVSALCRTLGCSRRPSRGAGRDRCTQHGGPGPQARTTNCFFFFNFYLY